MAQSGSGTVITKATRLLILDCFETLVELAAERYRPRKGVIGFLEHFTKVRRIPMVVASDADERSVRGALEQAVLAAYFQQCYHSGNAVEKLGDGRIRKRLDVPIREAKLQPFQAVFIGDSPMDAEAATFHQVPFIRVPRSEDRAFSFITLIGGPSRYDSAEFSATFLEQYLSEGDKDPDPDKKP
jgi:phosphoglycolate phosphatase-like HAD superfamily hydrolase